MKFHFSFGDICIIVFLFTKRQQKAFVKCSEDTTNFFCFFMFLVDIA